LLPFLYIFLDEGGNFDFSPGGTRHYTITAVSKVRPFLIESALLDVKYDLAEVGFCPEFFHASEDMQDKRNKVFGAIKEHLSTIRIDSIVIEKPKTGPYLQAEERFYPRMMGYLLDYILIKGHNMDNYRGVVVITDSIPVKKKNSTVEKSLKTFLAKKLEGKFYSILHHSSKSCIGLQIADYCNWAIYRKWEKKDLRSYDLVQPAIRSEFEIFRFGTVFYY
jgi:hypothetical protein